jgi:hypothetical protein
LNGGISQAAVKHHLKGGFAGVALRECVEGCLGEGGHHHMMHPGGHHHMAGGPPDTMMGGPSGGGGSLAESKTNLKTCRPFHSYSYTYDWQKVTWLES